MGRILITAFAALGLAPIAFAAPAPITGRWATDDGKAIIDIHAYGAKICGKVQKLLVAQPAGGQRDERNSDKAKRTRQVQGLQILWDLTVNDKAWKGNLSGRGNKMTRKGCGTVFCRTVTGTRLK